MRDDEAPEEIMTPLNYLPARSLYTRSDEDCSMACLQQYSDDGGACPAFTFGTSDDMCEFGTVADCSGILDKDSDAARKVIMNQDDYEIKTGTYKK